MDKKRDFNSKQSITAPLIIGYIKDVEYPAWKEDFIIFAEDNHAPIDVLKVLETIPDEEYESMVDVHQMLEELLEPEVLE